MDDTFLDFIRTASARLCAEFRAARQRQLARRRAALREYRDELVSYHRRNIPARPNAAHVPQ